LPSILFDLPLETAGKRDYRQARARHLSEAARLNVATAAWQVRGNLRNSLIDLAAAEKRREVLQRQLSLQEEIITMLEQRRQAGAISSVETTAARVALAKTGVDLAESERLRAESRARLSGAVGVPIRALDEIALAPASAAGAEAGELAGSEARRRALESRFDILGALAEYAASQSALQLEIAKQYPDVHLGTGYQWDQGDNKWQLGLTAEIPVLNRNQGPIAEAEARRSEAAARFEAIQAKVLAEVDRAVETFRASEKNLTNLEALAAALRTQRQTIEAEVTAGAADRLDLLNSQIELSTTELIRLDGQLKREQALAALEDVTQRPLDFYPAAFRSARAHAD
jgi:outer membrane protein TolC